MLLLHAENDIGPFQQSGSDLYPGVGFRSGGKCPVPMISVKNLLSRQAASLILAAYKKQVHPVTHFLCRGHLPGQAHNFLPPKPSHSSIISSYCRLCSMDGLISFSSSIVPPPDHALRHRLLFVRFSYRDILPDKTSILIQVLHVFFYHVITPNLSFYISFRSIFTIIVPILWITVFCYNFQYFIICIKFFTIFPAIIYSWAESRVRIPIGERDRAFIKPIYINFNECTVFKPGRQPGTVFNHHIMRRLSLHITAFFHKLMP